MFFKKKVIAKAEIFADNTAKVTASPMNVTKLYLACKKTLERQGVDLEMVDKMAKLVSAEEV